MDYTLKCGKTKAVVSTIGGTVLSFNVDGRDILFPYFVEKNGKARGGCPICSPYFGLVPEFGEKKHGYLRDIEATEIIGQGYNSIQMLFDCAGTPDYPWSLMHEVNVIVREGMLSVSLKIERPNDGLFDRAFINPGFHPYFSGYSDDILVVSGLGNYSGFSEHSKAFEIRSSALVIEENGKRIAMRLEGNFSKKSHVVLWSDDPERYFCVEPILSKDGRRLGIGESVEISMFLSLF